LNRNYFKYISTIFIISILIVPQLGFTQINDSLPASDTIHIKNNHFLILKDTLVFFLKDTIISIPDSVNYDIKSSQTIKSEIFYDSLRLKAYRNRILKELYHLTFRPAKKTTVKKAKTSKSESEYREHKGKVIGSITLKQLDVFGPTIHDTLYFSDSWVEKSANRIHVNTRDKVIRNNLLIKKGDRVDPFLLSDNERILRKLSYIDDARIIVISDTLSSDTIDILVLTKDVWSLGVDMKVKDINSASVSMYERNLFGMGHDFNNKVSFNGDEFPSWGYNGYYMISNIGRSFIDGRISYKNTFEQKIYGLNLSRGFVTPSIKYAGGLTVNQVKSMLNASESDQQLKETALEYSYQDIWIGRSLSLFKKQNNNLGRSKVIVSARIIRKQYLNRPYTAIDSNISYHNSIIYLNSLAISSRKYYKSNLIYSFGRTEDIPYGFLFEFIYGMEQLEYYDRLYTGLKITNGNYFTNIGYYYIGLSLGSYLRDSDFEQGAIKVDINLFSRIFEIKSFKFRHFFNVDYTNGINRTESERININKSNGLRDFESDLVRGTNKLVFTFESVCFTPVFFYGFKFAVFGFANVGTVGFDNSSIFGQNFYSGLGLGVRLRNENLIFKTIQIDFSFYPQIPPDHNVFKFNFGGESVLRLSDFDSKAPSVINYQ